MEFQAVNFAAKQVDKLLEEQQKPLHQLNEISYMEWKD